MQRMIQRLKEDMYRGEPHEGRFACAREKVDFSIALGSGWFHQSKTILTSSKAYRGHFHLKENILKRKTSKCVRCLNQVEKLCVPVSDDDGPASCQASTFRVPAGHDPYMCGSSALARGTGVPPFWPVLLGKPHAARLGHWSHFSAGTGGSKAPYVSP